MYHRYEKYSQSCNHPKITDINIKIRRKNIDVSLASRIEFIKFTTRPETNLNNTLPTPTLTNNT